MTYCISDIHGEYDLFMRLLEKIQYASNDRLIVCGDFIDKGTASVRLTKTIFSLPNAHCIMGNHEYMFLKYYRAKMDSNVFDFDKILLLFQEYFTEDGKLLDWDTIDRLVELPFYLEDSDFICVHAGVPLDKDGKTLPLSMASAEELVYDRHFKNPRVLPQNSKCILFGHTPTTYIGSTPKILIYPKSAEFHQNKSIKNLAKVHLDTGASINSVLGCFCVDTCRAFYVTK